MAAKIAIRPKAKDKKDEGERFRIINAKTRKPIYPGEDGMSKEDAERLSASLIAETEVVLIGAEEE